MAIRNIKFSEVLTQIKATAEDIICAAQGANYYTLVEEWQPVGYYNSKGARLEARRDGDGFDFRLNGYAHDGSDVL